ncbi:MAG TPA: hypothetical protein DCP92_02075 [Nitrospiraceae bacterium]|nr:hypothetical protein [Nitrospiraceae bacterium]
MKGTFDSPWLEQLFLEYIEEKDRRQNPETVYKSIARDKPLFEKLGQHFSGPGELNRAVFWRNFYELHRTRTGQLYAFLQEKSYLSRTGVRTDDLIRQQRTLKLLQSMPEDFREVATAYHGRLTAIRQKKLDANWEPDDYGIGTLETIDLTIRFIGKFIRSLSKRGLKGITEVTSDIVDEYIADNRNIGGCIVDFMHWLHREKYILFKYKSDWKAQKYSVSRPMNDDKYDLLVDGFLNGLHPLKESLICLFALVYGIRIDTMLKIKTRDFRQDGKRLFLKLPYVELEIHDVVAVMVQKYLNETSSVNPFDAENPYLFYGWAYNEPLQYDSVRNVFSKHRIQARQIIPTAVRNFFDNGVRSPRVWMKSLGISRRTAAKYYESYNPTVLEEMNLNKRLYGSIK